VVVRRMCVLVLPAVAVLLAVPELVLSLFGESYADNSTTLLRLLALGVVAKSVTTLYFSLARVERKVSRIATIEAVRLVLLLGSAWWLMGKFGLAGIGIAYLATQFVVAAAVVPAIVRVVRVPAPASPSAE
jgi:O-antigen/teichoic acid export membrane protein